MNLSGFAVRFSYDSTKFTPSNIQTNEITDDVNLYFCFEDEFNGNLEMDTVKYDDAGANEIYAICSFYPPVDETEHIKEKDEVGKVVDTNGSVLLGKMSFQMTADEFDISDFSLVENQNHTPTTGIKINIGNNKFYDAQSTFRFTDGTASKDNYLSNLIVSRGTSDDGTYKEYAYTPIFNKETNNYELKILEYIDDLDITATLSDSNATMKLKAPKRDDDNELVYDSGGDIEYEEKDLENDVQLQVILNKLGEPDTSITIEVTAENGDTNSYELVVKRPYGTIIGNIIYDQIEDNENPDLNKTTDLNFYTTGKFDWDQLLDIFGEIYDDPLTYDDLDLIEKDIFYESNADGTFEAYVIPGTYDLQIDKRGFLDYIVTDITVNEGDVIDLEDKTILAGDVNRDGVIGLEDIQEVVERVDLEIGDPDYDECYDLVQYDVIGLESVQYCVTNTDEMLTIEKY